MSNPTEKIKELDEFKQEDYQPVIEAQTQYVTVETGYINNPSNFLDRDGFPSRFVKEAETIAKLVPKIFNIYFLQHDVLTEGEHFTNTLYTYRSISRAVPTVKQDVTNKSDLYRKIFDVIDPEIKKIRDLLTFYFDAIQKVTSLIAELIVAEKRKEIPSDTLLDTFIRVLDLIFKLDALKNMKAAFSNDFAALKRAIQFMNRDGLDPAMPSLDIQSNENIRLYDFLSKTNYILKGLKEEVQKIQGFEEVMYLVITRCADNFEENRYVFCDEKFSFLRVCALGIFLLDTGSGDKPNYLKKLESLSRVCKLFKRYPCMPLYCDMTFVVKTILKSCNQVSDSEWLVAGKEEQKLEQSYLLSNSVAAIRKDFTTFISRWSILQNRLRSIQKTPNVEIPESVRAEAKSLTEQGIYFIAGWTTRVLEQSAWKYSHPVAISKLEQQNSDSPAEEKTDKKDEDDEGASTDEGKREISDYERVVRFNYTAEERTALVDVIAMIKGIEGVMQKSASIMLPLIRTQLYLAFQDFTAVTLADLLDRTKKKKRPIHNAVQELRNMAADFIEKPADPKKKKKEGPEYGKRPVAPSPTQLHMFRSILTTLYSERSAGMVKKGLFGDVDFSSEQCKLMQQFYQESFIWPYLLNYSTTLRKASDLASLWYREFYLEISKRIQFPIEMSLPWILTEDIIEKRNTTLMESIIYPLSLYNDAANHALFNLKRKFLYDEIEAEVNLVFDQLVYKLSEQIYAYYKIAASNICLDTKFRSGIERLSPKGQRFTVPKSRYDVILTQKHINLLGRYVDLNFLIAQRINGYLRENVTKVIQKFESNPLTNILEFEALMDVIRVAHQLLSQQMALDPFETIVAETNESLSMASFEGRIGRHIAEELMMDIFPTFNYDTQTQRFVQAPVFFGNVEYERDKMNRIQPMHGFGSKVFVQAFGMVLEQYRGYFGHEHIRCLIKMVGVENVALIVESVITFIEEKIYSELSPYVTALMEAIPPQVKLQPAAYGLYGVFAYFKMTFRDFLDYDMLKPGVYHGFRVIGNALCFLQLLDSEMITHNIPMYIMASPYLGLKPLSTQEKQARMQDKMAVLEEGVEKANVFDLFTRFDEPEKAPFVTKLYNFVNLPDVQAVLKSPDLAKDLPTMAARAVKLYNPPRASMSIYKQCLERMTTILNNVREEWKGTSPADRLSKLDSSKEFYRLWAILQFIFCIRDKPDKATDFENFGDGFFWGGNTIVYLFGQQLRFDAFNFTDHVLNINVISSKGREQITDFLNLAVEVRHKNNRVFNTLKTYYPLQYTQIENFSVPETEDFTKVKVVASVSMQNKPVQQEQASVTSFSQLSKNSLQSMSTAPPAPPSLDII